MLPEHKGVVRAEKSAEGNGTQGRLRALSSLGNRYEVSVLYLLGYTEGPTMAPRIIVATIHVLLFVFPPNPNCGSETTKSIRSGAILQHLPIWAPAIVYVIPTLVLCCFYRSGIAGLLTIMRVVSYASTILHYSACTRRRPYSRDGAGLIGWSPCQDSSSRFYWRDDTIVFG